MPSLRDIGNSWSGPNSKSANLNRLASWTPERICFDQVSASGTSELALILIIASREPSRLAF